jgi:hypothetical protein
MAGKDRQEPERHFLAVRLEGLNKKLALLEDFPSAPAFPLYS